MLKLSLVLLQSTVLLQVKVLTQWRYEFKQKEHFFIKLKNAAGLKNPHN